MQVLASPLIDVNTDGLLILLKQLVKVAVSLFANVKTWEEMPVNAHGHVLNLNQQIQCVCVDA